MAINFDYDYKPDFWILRSNAKFAISLEKSPIAAKWKTHILLEPWTPNVAISCDHGSDFDLLLQDQMLNLL